jgi:hypothetical protein
MSVVLATQNLKIDKVVVTTVAAATYSLLPTDYILAVGYTVTGSVAITIPTAQCVSGRIIEIKDSGGNASTNNITVTPQAETIDGDATLIISTNYNSASLYSDGNNWFVY